MKKVLIALDYGISAQKIAKQGFELAKSMNAKVTLIHVIADETYYNTIDSAPFIGLYGYDFFNIENNESLTTSTVNFLENIKSHLKATDVEVIAEYGDFATVILETAKKLQFDVIVLGSHSKNWLEKAVMGSVTETVLAKTTIPMFIIPIKDHKVA